MDRIQAGPGSEVNPGSGSFPGIDIFDVFQLGRSDRIHFFSRARHIPKKVFKKL